jgi:hypothetical protein
MSHTIQDTRPSITVEQKHIYINDYIFMSCLENARRDHSMRLDKETF